MGRFVRVTAVGDGPRRGRVQVTLTATAPAPASGRRVRAPSEAHTPFPSLAHRATLAVDANRPHRIGGPAGRAGGVPACEKKRAARRAARRRGGLARRRPIPALPDRARAGRVRDAPPAGRTTCSRSSSDDAGEVVGRRPLYGADVRGAPPRRPPVRLHHHRPQRRRGRASSCAKRSSARLPQDRPMRAPPARARARCRFLNGRHRRRRRGRSRSPIERVVVAEKL